MIAMLSSSSDAINYADDDGQGHEDAGPRPYPWAQWAGADLCIRIQVIVGVTDALMERTVGVRIV